jgi:hypothetical protein
MPFPLIAIAIGAGVGAVMSGGVYWWQTEDEDFTAGGLASNVAGGAVAGALTPVLAAVLGTSILGLAVSSGIAVGTGASTTRILENVGQGNEWWKGALQTAIWGLVAGGLLGGLGGKLLARLPSGTADAAANGALVALLDQGDVREGITEDQLRLLNGLCRASNIPMGDLLGMMSAVTGRTITDFSQLKREEAEKIIEALGGPLALTSSMVPLAPPDGGGYALGGGSATLAPATADENRTETLDPITGEPSRTPGLVERLTPR